MVDIFYCSFIHPFFSEQNDQKEEFITKEPEVIHSTTDIINMDISKMSELEFRIMIIKLLAGPEKSITDIRKSLSAEKI